jgi:hypothetical protein
MTCVRLPILLLALPALAAAGDRQDSAGFASQVAPILQRRCLSCHNDTERKGGLSLQSRTAAIKGGESGAVIAPGDPDGSDLLDLITPADGRAEMPKDADPLSAAEVDAIRRWIADGAGWPDDLRLEEHAVADTDWWSLQPVVRPALPDLPPGRAAWVRTPVDAFIAAKHQEHGLSPAAEADRRTLVRRLYYNLIGLPPPPADVDAFLADPDPRAYEQLVDRLLESPHYGERWARHWLDVVHYGDTHGYDKDKPRPNAWPYRDYVVRSLNSDKSYEQFVREQLAGDVLFPGDPNGVIATGLIAAGPWDFISHVEVPERKIDGRIARSIDRDDMVRTVMETLCSVTVGCARCHNHKFDPVTQRDYYNLQAVFAAVDRADRPYDSDPAIYHQRRVLLAEQRELQERKAAIDSQVERLAGEELKAIDARIAAADQQRNGEERPEFGYHSRIEPEQDRVKWVQVDLGARTEIAKVVYVGCHDNFNNIGAGFGFPVRYRIEASNDPEFQAGVVTLVDHTDDDVANPGVTPLTLDPPPSTPRQRYVRVTATKLTPRQNDYIFALAELAVLTPDGANAGLGKPVTALDSIEAPVRWRMTNLVDGYYYGVARDPQSKEQLDRLREQRQAAVERVLSADLKQQFESVTTRLAQLDSQLKQLPPPLMVYAAATQFAPQGSFQSTGGKPREVRVLHRGNILDPRELATPGALPFVPSLPATFDLSDGHTEGEARAALAAWIVHADNPLTWRSIVNRVWQHHFGRGLVDTPNDFGRMGAQPTHPELLDWLAADFRDNGGSLKRLHRLICNSATYRQGSGGSRVEGRESSAESSEQSGESREQSKDSDNLYLSRFPRRRLEAEAVRDAVLAVSGKLDATMYGPGFQDFVIEHPEHSPHYEYHLYDPEDPRGHRRSIYRFIVRSQQQPFMTTLDCADPSMQVDKRNETVTPLQALTLLNNRLMVAQARHFAGRVTGLGATTGERVTAAYWLALSRDPSEDERDSLVAYADEFGMENACRVILNLNEFVFVD